MNNKLKSVAGFGIMYVVVKWAFIGTIGTYLYKSGYWSNWYLLLVPVAGLLFFKLVGKKILGEPLPAYVPFFNRRVKEHFPSNFEAIQTEVSDHFHAMRDDIRFISDSGNPMDKRLDFCSYFLALIKTLDNRNEPFDRIRQICLEVVTDYVQPKNKIQGYIKRKVPGLISTRLGQMFIRALARKVGQNKYPEGFIAEIVTDKNDTYGLGYGVNILECGICKLFKKHGYEKYSSILCEVDEITTNLAGLKMIRTGTIATGAKMCDFRYVKKND